MRKPVDERFWSKVDKSGGPDACWPWLEGCKTTGYGSFYSHGRKVSAHRMAHELIYGPVPDGFSVLHRCDNPPCCNPAHLFLGTQLDNVRDMIQKGRHKIGWHKGEGRHPDSIPDDVLGAIRAKRDLDGSVSCYWVRCITKRPEFGGCEYRHEKAGRAIECALREKTR